MRLKVVGVGAVYFGCFFTLFISSVAMVSRQPAGISDNQTGGTGEGLTDLHTGSLNEPELSEWEIADARAAQIELDVGQRVQASIGTAPQLEWVGDQLALVFGVREQDYHLAQRPSGLYVAYSRNGVNWSEPIRLDDWDGQWATGSIVKRRDGSFIVIYAKPYPEGSTRARFFSRTSEDGYTWSPPTLLDVGIEPVLFPDSLSLTETSENRLVLAFCHEPEDGVIEICTSTDGMEWELGKGITLGGMGVVPTDIKITEHDGALWLAYCDVHVGEVVAYVARMQPNGSWTTANATGRKYFSFYYGASMAHLANGTIIVAFDHLGATYVSASRDMVDWEDPVEVPRIGTRPSIVPVGADSLLVAAQEWVDRNVIWVTLVGRSEG